MNGRKAFGIRAVFCFIKKVCDLPLDWKGGFPGNLLDRKQYKVWQINNAVHLKLAALSLVSVSKKISLSNAEMIGHGQLSQGYMGMCLASQS